eukprot:TRINITY_DN50750_c0_g1_i1.p1 TRINITY_DN50750_c0_g1~~TRINITY_DN50750_c0_g1_i1.p1  ORF type:complete len:655 (+),score=114.77 TRINITY_DN50750_c0_g1_i1:57-2021(+)
MSSTSGASKSPGEVWEKVVSQVQDIKERRKAAAKLARSGTFYSKKEMKDWSVLRRSLAQCASSATFEIFINIVVMFNVVVMVVEADEGMRCAEEPEGACVAPWLEIANNALLGIYTCEVILTLFIQRSSFWWRSWWNYLDLVISLTGYIEIVMNTLGSDSAGGLSMMRMLKLLRVARIMRLLKTFPELYMMVAGFVSTMKTMFWGFVLIIALLGVWGIIIIQTMTPTGVVGNLEVARCNEAFQTTFGAIVWFFQTLIAGDSWGQCVIPVMQQAGTGFFWLFACVHITIQIGFMNLILAVIVDSSAQTREERAEDKRKARKEKREEAISDISDLLRNLDTDDSGEISLEELMAGYEGNESLRERFDEIGIGRRDLSRLILAMDEDNSGEVDYEEFAEALLRFEETDPRAQALQTNLLIQELQANMVKRLSTVESLLQEAKLPAKVPCKTLDPKHQPDLEQSHQPDFAFDVPGLNEPVCSNALIFADSRNAEACEFSRMLTKDVELSLGSFKTQLQTLVDEVTQQVNSLAQQARAFSSTRGGTKIVPWGIESKRRLPRCWSAKRPDENISIRFADSLKSTPTKAAKQVSVSWQDSYEDHRSDTSKMHRPIDFDNVEELQVGRIQDNPSPPTTLPNSPSSAPPKVYVKAPPSAGNDM